MVSVKWTNGAERDLIRVLSSRHADDAAKAEGVALDCLDRVEELFTGNPELGSAEGVLKDTGCRKLWLPDFRFSVIVTRSGNTVYVLMVHLPKRDFAIEAIFRRANETD